MRSCESFCFGHHVWDILFTCLFEWLSFGLVQHTNLRLWGGRRTQTTSNILFVSWDWLFNRGSNLMEAGHLLCVALIGHYTNWIESALVVILDLCFPFLNMLFLEKKHYSAFGHLSVHSASRAFYFAHFLFISASWGTDSVFTGVSWISFSGDPCCIMGIVALVLRRDCIRERCTGYPPSPFPPLCGNAKGVPGVLSAARHCSLCSLSSGDLDGFSASVSGNDHLRFPVCWGPVSG